MKGDSMPVMVIFGASLILMIGAVFLYTRREDSDFAKLNSSVVEMIGQARLAADKADERTKQIDDIKESQDNMGLQFAALQSKVDLLDKSGGKSEVTVTPSGKPFTVYLIDSRESKKVSVPLDEPVKARDKKPALPGLQKAKKTLKEHGFDQ